MDADLLVRLIKSRVVYHTPERRAGRGRPRLHGEPFLVGDGYARIGEGTEVLTGADDTEMFDNADEDKDLHSQISKNPKESEAKEDSESKPAPESASTPAEKKQDEKAPEESKKD